MELEVGWRGRVSAGGIMRWILIGVFAAVAVLCMTAGTFGAPPQNLDFEQEPRNGSIPGWFIPPVCAQAGWSGNIIEEKPAQGSWCLEMMQHRPEASPAGGASGRPACSHPDFQCQLCCVRYRETQGFQRPVDRPRAQHGGSDGEVQFERLL